jgi:protein TonB
LRGIGGGCDEEGVRVVSSMPKWTPGKQRGKAVRVQYNLPIKFALESKTEKKDGQEKQ